MDVTPYVFVCRSPSRWTSTTSCWLPEERARGAAGARAAVEEQELNLPVESRVNLSETDTS